MYVDTTAQGGKLASGGGEIGEAKLEALRIYSSPPPKLTGLV